MAQLCKRHCCIGYQAESPYLYSYSCSTEENWCHVTKEVQGDIKIESKYLRKCNILLSSASYFHIGSKEHKRILKNKRGIF